MNQQIPLNKLIISPRNVRVVNPSKAADKELIASIKSQGLLQNLVVIPVKGGKFEVVAGGRRLAGLQYLAKNKDIAKDYPTDCKVKSEEDGVIEISLAENTLRSGMHPADEFTAYTKMIEEDGYDVSDVAQRFGKSRTYIKQRLSLGRVAPRLLNEFRKSKLTLEAIMAFTLSGDQERQLACYKELSKSSRLHPHLIKNWLTGEAITTANGIGAFVGKPVYTNAGGAISSDLFENTVYMSDVELVYQLAEEKLTKAAEKIVSDEGWQWFEVVCGSNFEDAKRGMVQLFPDLIGAPLELSEKITKLRAELHDIEDKGHEEDWPEELDKAFDSKEKEIEQAVAELEEYRAFTDEQKAYSGIIVGVAHNGKLLVERGAARREDVLRVETDENSTVAASVSAPQAEDKRISNALREDLGGYRQQATKATMISKPAVAMDVLFYTICMQTLSDEFWRGRDLLGATFNAVVSVTSKNDLDDSPATLELANAKTQLDTEWMAIENDGNRFDAFRALPKRTKERLITYCVASLLKINARGSSDAQDHLVDLLEVPFRKYWRPTRENYLSRLSLPLLVSTFEPLRSKDWAGEAADDKKGRVVDGLVEWFNNPPSEAVESWVPAEF